MAHLVVTMARAVFAVEICFCHYFFLSGKGIPTNIVNLSGNQFIHGTNFAAISATPQVGFPYDGFGPVPEGSNLRFRNVDGGNNALGSALLAFDLN